MAHVPVSDNDCGASRKAHRRPMYGNICLAFFLILATASLTKELLSTEPTLHVAFSSCKSFEPLEPFQADRKHYHLDFENQHITVLRLTLGADGFIPAHSSPGSLLVCIINCDIRLESPGQRIHDVHMEPGESRWIASSTRSEKNIGGRSLEIVMIQAKGEGSSCR